MKIGITLLLILIGYSDVFSQMKRKRVRADGPVEAVFKAPKLITFNTTKNIDPNTLHLMIQHGFGPIQSWDNYQELWGIDGSANIRFSLDWGLSDKWSVGIGRTKTNKAYDFRSKYTLLQQTRSGSTPISMAIDATVGVRTDSPVGNFSTFDRTFAGLSLPISRYVNDDLSLLFYPSAAWFAVEEFVSPDVSTEQFYVALGLGGRYKLTNRTVLTAEYLPVYSDGLRTVLSFGVEIETGSHVFQMFVTTSQFYTDPYMLRYATNLRDGVLNHLRIGFNVNRLFWFN